ncbi:MAG: M6 family metalloprotease domain-containing protein [Bacteroidaceae bacterium]|nr:M6 family metalloprotease domain-containing protein [Bacteroidaceae bacterium]
MRLILTFLFIILPFSILSASPAQRIKNTIVYNGERIEVVLCGDEDCHYWLAADGRRFVQTENNVFSLLTDNPGSRALTTRRKSHVFSSSLLSDDVRKKRKLKNIGNKRGLVILVQFSDVKFCSNYDTKHEIEKIMSAENLKGTRNFGSVRDYFKAQSYGQLDYCFDVTEPVTLTHPLSYYGGNDKSGDDLHPAAMVYEACQLVDEDIDFSQYDNDGDGYVDEIYVIYAGTGENASYKADDVWPHSWALSGGEAGVKAISADGVIVDDYACSAELNGNGNNKQLTSIGCIVHEFSHTLGLPDFYCTDYNHSLFVVDDWSVMDYGFYNDNGYTPCSYTAYERWLCGWTEPTELSEAENITGMKNIDVDGESYIIYNDGNRNEYFVLQNIQKTGWNSFAPANGLLILHIDYNQNAWYNGTINNKKDHLRMFAICADNIRSYQTCSGDTYPGTSKNTVFSNYSKPSSEVYNMTKSGVYFLDKPITNIAETDDGHISFHIDGGKIIDEQAELKIDTVSEDGISLSWSNLNNTDYYVIGYGNTADIPQGESKKLLNDDFLFEGLKGDGTTDISDILDNFLATTGYTGKYIYKSPNGLKINKKGGEGYIITPTLKSNTSTATLTFNAQPYNTDDTYCDVIVLDKNDNIVSDENRIHIGTESQYSAKLSLPTEAKIKLSFINRAYLSHIDVKSDNDDITPCKLVSDIINNKFTLMPSFQCNKYYIQVKAVQKDGTETKWSNRVTASATIPSSISQTKISSKSSDTKIHYNLQGQRVSSDYKGIVIVNGKKTLIIN